MTVIVLEAVPKRLRGQLTRWMLELRAGVFVGTLSARVRDHLWNTVTDDAKGGTAVMAHPARTEQGFRIRTHGDATRTIIDIDGLQLVHHTYESKAPF